MFGRSWAQFLSGIFSLSYACVMLINSSFICPHMLNTVILSVSVKKQNYSSFFMLDFVFLLWENSMTSLDTVNSMLMQIIQKVALVEAL